jgi:hypothetical protein
VSNVASTHYGHKYRIKNSRTRIKLNRTMDKGRDKTELTHRCYNTAVTHRRGDGGILYVCINSGTGWGHSVGVPTDIVPWVTNGWFRNPHLDHVDA